MLGVAGTVACALASASCACGVATVAYRAFLRSMHRENATRGLAEVNFFASWQFGETSVLVLLYTASYLGAVSACVQRMMELEGMVLWGGCTSKSSDAPPP